MSIPVVDFTSFKLDKSHVSDEDLEKLGVELRAAFTGVGFVYLANTGIVQSEVDKVMAISKKFFLLPEEKKRPFERGNFANSNHGWVSFGRERLNPRRPGDLKESFNISSLCPDINWPSDGVAEFRETLKSFYLRCEDLSLRVLKLMALSLDLNPDVFLEAHTCMSTDDNATTLRTLYYPPVDTGCVKDSQVRCGEHSDYGSITLLFQGPEGGLQVQSRTGTYLSVPSIPGTVLVNIADLMQRWTGDVFISAVHRVLLPSDGDSSSRQSLAFFVHPDDQAVITCCDGSNKYPPVKALDYLMERFGESYGST
ncbi:2-oxoglutarate-dependent dioxygenase htyE [Denticeps clupeoides]|uniref:Fe2OG dioxygenase domain-containing protein n=1 Tax=Denticeps clupeoides TaxID=299321 RepID=A0AAY4CDM2_9TELE|nr:2-oxoglutarate-dependent dioxygenase htyE-like [Denticeps clupeoides]